MPRGFSAPAQPLPDWSDYLRNSPQQFPDNVTTITPFSPKECEIQHHDGLAAVTGDGVEVEVEGGAAGEGEGLGGAEPAGGEGGDAAGGDAGRVLGEDGVLGNRRLSEERTANCISTCVLIDLVCRVQGWIAGQLHDANRSS